MIKCYLGLGSNLGDRCRTLNEALEAVRGLDHVFSFKKSRFFITTPVSDIPQNDFINTVCGFYTTLDVFTLHAHLQKIESALGKVEKQKNAPRLIDIDILFYGKEVIESGGLSIPHPEWRNRLFVLKPLRDLTKTLLIPETSSKKFIEVDLELLLENFINIHQESVTPLDLDSKES